MELFTHISPVALAIAVAVVLLGLLVVSGVVRYIANYRIGVVEKLWSSSGSVKRGLLAFPELERF